jgi:hypothetical protein
MIRVRVPLDSAGRHLLAQRGTLRVIVTATNVSGGHTATSAATLTLIGTTRLRVGHQRFAAHHRSSETLLTSALPYRRADRKGR